MFEPSFLGAISRILKIISYDFPCRYPTPHLGTTRRKQKNNFQRHADQSVQAQAFADKRLPALRGAGLGQVPAKAGAWLSAVSLALHLLTEGQARFLAKGVGPGGL